MHGISVIGYILINISVQTTELAKIFTKCINTAILNLSHLTDK